MNSTILHRALMVIVWGTCLTSSSISLAAKKVVEPSFSQFPVKQQFHGKSAMPRFNDRDRDRDFKLYKTILRYEMKLGPNFAGKYRVIQIGCGAGCIDTYIANNKTGQVFAFPRGGEKNPDLQLTFKRSSNLIVVQWGDTHKNACLKESFKWQGQSAKLLGTKKIGDLEYCFRQIHMTLTNPSKPKARLKIDK